MFVGKGDSLLPNKMLLTSGDIISINNNDIQIGGGSFQITKDTKICGNFGKRSKLDTFKTGDGVTIISLRKENEALTLKMGLALYSFGQYGASLDKTSYECK